MYSVHPSIEVNNFIVCVHYETNDFIESLIKKRENILVHLQLNCAQSTFICLVLEWITWCTHRICSVSCRSHWAGNPISKIIPFLVQR